MEQHIHNVSTDVWTGYLWLTSICIFYFLVLWLMAGVHRRNRKLDKNIDNTDK